MALATDNARFDIIPRRFWKNSKTNATASIYGATPYTSDATKNDWAIIDEGYTIRDNLRGTVGGFGSLERLTIEERRDRAKVESVLEALKVLHGIKPEPKIFEYMVADHFLPALINDDWEGLTGEDEHNLRLFILEVSGQAKGDSNWHWSTNSDDDNGNFERCEICGLLANCETLQAVFTGV